MTQGKRGKHQCQIAEPSALIQHRGEMKCGVGFAKHRQADGGWTHCWSSWFICSCLPPVFWDALLTNEKSGRDTEEGPLSLNKKEKSTLLPLITQKQNKTPWHVLLRALSLLPTIPDSAILTSNVSTRTSAVTKGRRGIGNFTKSTSRKFCRKRSRFLAS